MHPEPHSALRRVAHGLLCAALTCFTQAVSAQPAYPDADPSARSRQPDPCNPRDRERVKMRDVLTDSEHVVGHKLLLENDMNSGGDFLSGEKSDRWYTSGIKLITMLKEDTRPTWFSNVLPDFACWWGARHDFQFGYVLGHMMYTPSNILDPYPQVNDRYWAAWAYVGTIVQFRDKKDARTLQTYEFDIGLTGRPALGEPLQKTIHGIIGSPQPQGWDNQLKSELAANVTYLGMYKLGDARRLPLSGNGLKWDATVHGGFALGTVFNYVNAGLTLRIGNSLAGTPIGTIEVPSLGGGDKWQEGNWYLFARYDQRATAYNLFLDGSLFRADPHASTVKSKDTSYYIHSGITYESSKKNRWTLSLNRRSREFNAPASDRGIQNFTTLVWEHRFR